jgi:hypothetical protein
VNAHWPALLLALSNVVTLVLLAYAIGDAKHHRRMANTWRGLSEDWERACDEWVKTADSWQTLATEFLHKLPYDNACSEPEPSARCRP